MATTRCCSGSCLAPARAHQQRWYVRGALHSRIPAGQLEDLVSQPADRNRDISGVRMLPIWEEEDEVEVEVKAEEGTEEEEEGDSN